VKYPANRRKGRLIPAIVIGVLAVAVTACATPASAPPTRSAPSAPSGSRLAHVAPAVAAQLAEVTAIPFKASDAGWATMPLAQLTPRAGQPLTAGGKPEVLYAGAEFCPYCAAENWALLVALGRFGTFAGVNEIRSASYPPIPPLDSWTFYGSSYSSQYLAFVPVEMYSTVLVSPRADPLRAASYRLLQKLTPAQRVLVDEADKAHGTPFTDFGGQAVMIGSPIPAQTLEHLTWSQLTSALRARRGAAAQAVIGAADYLTAELCTLTRDRPATACPASIKVFQPLS
jgi:Domain of unknown function (DUF929)